MTDRVLMLAPTGDDAAVAARVLNKAGLELFACASTTEIGEHLEQAGALLIAEEALQGQAGEALFGALDEQPTWSDVPVILLTREKALSASLPDQIADLSKRANVTLLERPIRVATLVTILQSALRARHRQLLLRDALLAASAARAQAESANAAKSKFLSTMSHELRTPLNAIAGYTQLLSLEVRGPTTDEQRKFIDGIMRNEQHLLSLINDILYFAKIEAGALNVTTADVDIAPMISGLETFISPQLAARNMALTITCPPSINVHCDEEKLRQILLNLLSNAIKFSPPGGAIALTCAQIDGKVEIAVVDRGEGIPADQLDSIFAPFVQVGRANNRPMEGTGLGLAISRDLARNMGGDLTVASEPGHGSTFTVLLNIAG